MARPLPILLSALPIHIGSRIYIFFAVMLTVCIVSLVSFICASDKRQNQEDFTRRKLSRKNLLQSFSKANSISSKALLKIVSWRKQVQHGDEENEYCDINYTTHRDYIVVDDEGFQREDAVWKKTIIKGERCKPLDFSGKIEYDSEGNLVSDKSIDDSKLR